MDIRIIGLNSLRSNAALFRAFLMASSDSSLILLCNDEELEKINKQIERPSLKDIFSLCYDPLEFTLHHIKMNRYNDINFPKEPPFWAKDNIQLSKKHRIKPRAKLA